MRRPCCRRRRCRPLVTDVGVQPSGQSDAAVGRVDAHRELAVRPAVATEGAAVVGEVDRRGWCEQLRNTQLQGGNRARTGERAELGRLAGLECERALRVRCVRLGRLRVPAAGRCELVNHIHGPVGRVEGRHPVRIGEGAGGDVVVHRVGVGGDPHRPLKRHRRDDVDPAGALVGVGDHRKDERRPELAVHDVLQRRVQHRPAVEGDVNASGSADVAFVASEPDRVDLTGPLVLGQHVTVCRAGQRVGVVTVEATPVEAEELLGLYARAQLGQPVEVAVDVPAHRALPWLVAAGGGRSRVRWGGHQHRKTDHPQ